MRQCTSVLRLVATAFPGWDPNRLLERIQQHLERRRCRIVIVADAVSPDVVWEAARRRPTLGGISLDLINVKRRTLGPPSFKHIDMDPATYERSYRPPPVAAPEWETVERVPVRATEFMRRMVKDRFYKKGDYRITRTGYLPAVLYYEAAPGRAPMGDLHQVERSRREGCAPVMPNLGLLLNPIHNNPYPRDGLSTTVVTDSKYLPIVAVCHATWKFLREHRHFTLSIDDKKEVQHEIVKRAGVTLDELSSEVRWVALTAPFDAMRDCALYGLVRHSRRGHHKHRFEIIDLPADFATTRS